MRTVLFMMMTAILAAPAAGADELRFAKANLKLIVPGGCTLTKAADKEKYSGRCKSPAATLVISEMSLAVATEALNQMHTGKKEGLTDVKWMDVRSGTASAGHERWGRGMGGVTKSGAKIIDQYTVVKGSNDRALLVAFLGMRIEDIKPMMMAGSRLIMSLDDITPAADTGFKISGDASKCTKTAVKELRHTPAGKDAPLVFDNTRFTVAKARYRARKGKLEIFVASKDWPLEAFGTAPFPIESEKDAYLAIRVLGKGKRLGAGTYHAKRDATPGVKMDIISKGMIAAKNLGEKSTVTITAVTADKVCGTFNLMGIFDGEHARATGSFVAPLPK
jgi:hypothetical protein